MTIEGRQASFAIPVTTFGDDEDGNIDIAGVIGDTFQPLDWIPDEGHGTIRAFTDASWISAEPSSGVLAPGDGTSVLVGVGDPDLQPGDLEGFLYLLSDAPKQRAIPIPIEHTVRRPDSWGAAAGRVRDAHSGEPLEDVTVTLHTRWQGEELRLRTTTDERGDWSLQGPEGGWDAVAGLDGYVREWNTVAIRAGRTMGEQGFRLHLDAPHATIDTRSIPLTLERGGTASYLVTLGNEHGHRDLRFTVGEIALRAGTGGGGGGGGGDVEEITPLELPPGARSGCADLRGHGPRLPRLDRPRRQGPGVLRSGHAVPLGRRLPRPRDDLRSPTSVTSSTPSSRRPGSGPASSTRRGPTRSPRTWPGTPTASSSGR